MHADWLGLVEPNGPFLTLPVLRRVWPNGLDHLDADTRAEVRRHLADLDFDVPSSVTTWVEWVLTDLLAYGPRLQSGPQVSGTLAHVVAEHGAVLRPDHVLNDGSGHPQLLVSAHPPATRLDARPAGDRWSATPVERLALLCRATGVELGLTTNAISWVLVWAPKGGATGTATFSADLFSEEPALLDAFVSVLGARRFFAVAETDRLDALLAESASAQAEVTGKLGGQVRQAVELLVAAMSRADRDRHGELLAEVHPHQVYQGAVGVLMRLVLLLYAEERGLLPLGDEFYDRTLAASTLLDHLREVQADAGDEPLERSQTAWYRLLALSRAVHSGITHDRLRIPAYGGGLFDPDRFEFLEGRRPGEGWHDIPAQPLPVDDLTVLAMLSALQELRFSEGGVTETRRLTYRALDVEQVGHVYEGLLDHSAVKAAETAVGLVGKAGREPEVSLSDLTSAATKGRDAFVVWLTDVTGRTAKQIERLLDADADSESTRLLRAACDNDEALTSRLIPYAHLLRSNLRGLPTVFPAGSMYVTQTGAKRDSGTAYTTKELADEVVEHALAPLVYSPGPTDGADPADWKLRPSVELLELKVCDPAVGSGAILVAACRYLGKRLVEAWTAEAAHEAEGDSNEVIIAARRAVVDRCLYGVDRDPMAVEMAKLSLWLVTLSKERPFNFLDHALKAGDSLLGITDLEQLRALHLDPAVGRRKVGLSLNPEAVDEAIARAVELRRRLESIPVLTVRDAEEKAQLNSDADRELDALSKVADLVVGCAVRAELTGQAPPEDQIAASAPFVAAALDVTQPAEVRQMALTRVESRAREALNAGRPDLSPDRIPLHWPLMFPEVFVNLKHPRFNAMVSNPPFLGGTKISRPLGRDYRDFIARWIARRKTDRADLISFFFLRAAQISDRIAFLATNTVSQGDTREVGLQQLLAHGWTITRAVKTAPWPGVAGVEVAKVWMQRKAWAGELRVDDVVVHEVTSYLERARRTGKDPMRLATNRGQAFLGDQLNSLGFLISKEEADQLLADSSRNAEVVLPYLDGNDLNFDPEQRAKRSVISFFDWPLQRAQMYPACLAVLEERVRPEVLRKLASYRGWDKRWWQFWMYKAGLHDALANMDRTLAVTRVSNTLQVAFVGTRQIMNDKVVVFAYDDHCSFAILMSSLHQLWAIAYSSTLRNATQYTPSDCFETFAQPAFDDTVEAAGKALDEHRTALMIRNGEGLTKTFNRTHDPEDSSFGISRLRELHVAIDVAVRDAYGWCDLDLDHGFHHTPQGRRFTLGPAARTEVLDRLLELNHQRYAEEVAAGLHDRKVPKKRKPPTADTPTLL